MMKIGILQEWQAELAQADAPDEHRKALSGAIQALETGAALQSDEAQEVPDGHGYGVPRKD